jgi:hypothetical protein
MRIRHPRSLDGDAPGIAIDVRGETVLPDEAGHYDIGDHERWLNRYADSYDVDPEDLVVGDIDDTDDTDDADDADEQPDTCDTVKADGEVCGRELPCPYHSDTDSDTDED